MTLLHNFYIQAADSPTIDAFNRLRTSDPYCVFSSKLSNDKSALLWDEKLFGTGSSTHSATDARVRLATSAASDAGIRQTFQRFNYQPGKSTLVLMTFQGSQEANVRKRVGLFETSNVANSVPQNGIYLEITSSDITVNIAKAGSVTETVSRSSNQWNIDKLDGSGVSGITINLAYTQILVFDLEWLGVGRVRVGFVVNGIIVWFHEFNHANKASFTSVYMSTACLPLNYSIYQSGAGSGSLDAICGTVLVEGGVSPLGVTREHNTGSAAITCTSIGTIYALLGIRQKTTHDNVTIEPLLASSLAITTNDTFLISLRRNPTVAGTFNYSDKTNSAVQTATGATANTVTGGEILWSAYGKTDTAIQLPTRLLPYIGKAIDGTLDTLVLTCTPCSASIDMFASLVWLEQT